MSQEVSECLDCDKIAAPFPVTKLPVIKEHARFSFLQMLLFRFILMTIFFTWMFGMAYCASKIVFPREKEKTVIKE